MVSVRNAITLVLHALAMMSAVHASQASGSMTQQRSAINVLINFAWTVVPMVNNHVLLAKRDHTSVLMENVPHAHQTAIRATISVVLNAIRSSSLIQSHHHAELAQ